MKPPKISVLMAVYNGERFVVEAVESILQQDFADWELVVVNDGSTDGTLLKLKRFAEADPRLRVISRKRRGLTVSLQEALLAARGEFVMRQDADDVSRSDRMSRMVGAMSGADFAVSFWENEEQGRIWRPMLLRLFSWAPNPAWLWVARHVNLFVHGTYFFRREAVTAIGGYRAYFEFAQDYDLLLRASGSLRFAIVREPLYRLRRHGGSLTSRNRNKQIIYAWIGSLLAKERESGTPDRCPPDRRLSPDTYLRALMLRYPLRALSLPFFHMLRALHASAFSLYFRFLWSGYLPSFAEEDDGF